MNELALSSGLSALGSGQRATKRREMAQKKSGWLALVQALDRIKGLRFGR